MGISTYPEREWAMSLVSCRGNYPSHHPSNTNFDLGCTYNMMLAKANTDQTVETYCIVWSTSIASVFGQHKMKWNFHATLTTAVTVLFPHRSVLLFFHTHCLLTWRGRRLYTNTLYLFIHTDSSFCFFDLSTDLANS